MGSLHPSLTNRFPASMGGVDVLLVCRLPADSGKPVHSRYVRRRAVEEHVVLLDLI